MAAGQILIYHIVRPGVNGRRRRGVQVRVAPARRERDQADEPSAEGAVLHSPEDGQCPAAACVLYLQQLKEHCVKI